MQVLGLPIPPGTVRFVVRPVLRGSGKVLAMYEAEVPEGGTLPAEADIIAAVATNEKFWAWVGVITRAKRLDAAATGLYEWRVKVEFFDRQGVKSESACSDEVFEFYQLCGTTCMSAPDPSAAAIQAMREVQTQFLGAQERMAKEHAALFKSLIDGHSALAQQQLAAAKDVIATAAQEAAKVLGAGAQPLQDAVGRIVQQSQHEQTKRDEATKDVITLLQKGQSDDDLLSQLAKVAPLVPVAKQFLN